MGEVKIFSRYDPAKVLFVAACDTIGEAARMAVTSHANLSGANLYCADLSGANLSGANLSRADLSGANLYCADLSRANLSGANLYCADLYGANLSRADLSGANLYGADLSGANLSGANLSRADLSRADLSGANLYGANLYCADLSGAKNVSPLASAQTSIVPEIGAVTGWKQCRGGVIVKVRVPDGVPRSSATGRKCRAESVEVVEVVGADIGYSIHDDGKTEYVVGKTVRCDAWNPDRWIECGGGIHFFITRAEAEAYQG